MKKHLIAAAVAGLIAAPAMAQVTVYGNLETGILNQDVSGVKDDPKTANEDESKTKNVSTTALTSSVVNSSRLGFRGSEDLGGGLKAFFRLEQSVDIKTGRLGGSTTTQMFDRGAEVGLEGSFGSVKIGKFDVTSAEGIDSSVSYFGNVGNFSGIDIGSDINHAIQYKSPKIGGFNVEIGHAFKDGSTSALTHNETTSFFVGGEVAKIKMQLGFTTDKTLAGIESDVLTLGLAYDFGPVAVSLASGVKSTDGKGDVGMGVITARFPLGSGLNIHFMSSAYEVEAYGSAKSQETTRAALGLSKAFSKRTTGYLAAIGEDKDGVETGQLYLGVNHRF
jgi:predicted porin